MKLSDLLKAIKDNPDDLSKLPDIIAGVEKIEGDIDGYQERITKLQGVNQSLLSQIPIPGETNAQEETEEEKEPTLEDAKTQIITALHGEEGGAE